ncbi:MAG: murein L,D-transpeptidase [Aquabacterium sp.]|jgi:hypothetical protein|uniref:murein L,D-transpeptidase n=1 Tax=Aquabacterium sp. TaxID=1872578 RepID=UPI001B507171|nr:murein L,D-transpeptidase [Aquabacterium sp.]MBP7131532.1 murein L,D-transpeptidase [Aquabacterium sp.]MDQ5925873.1 Murein L,D-transpeptidase [Pseudomonadota bacterium]
MWCRYANLPLERQRIARWMAPLAALVLAGSLSLPGHTVEVLPGTDGEGPAAPLATTIPVLRTAFIQLVTKRSYPDDTRLAHLQAAARQAFATADLPWPAGELFLLIDRHPQSQEAVVALATEAGGWEVIGSSLISTGKPGSYDHFITPLGLFSNGDHHSFRAEGTFNDNGIRGYGLKGLRVFDLGWVPAEKGWEPPGTIPIRLQVHATDPVLEQRLGTPASKGCIRLDAGLNRFLDQYSVLDARFEAAQATTGVRPWFWLPDRTPTPWSGSWVVIVDVSRATPPPVPAP